MSSIIVTIINNNKGVYGTLFMCFQHVYEYQGMHG